MVYFIYYIIIKELELQFLYAIYDNKILQSVTDQTGGELYYAYTAEQLLDAFSHISSNNLLDFDLTDTDGDGISDGDEMGLLRKSSALTIQSFDFPTLALPDIGMYFGNGLFSKNVFMFQMNSHPNEPDSDGDLDTDKTDPHPTTYCLNDRLLENILELSKLASKFVIENDFSISLNTNIETWLSFMFIRQFNEAYKIPKWNGVGGNINNCFVNYVRENNNNLYLYFANCKNYNTTKNGDYGDLYHMAATVTGYIYKSGYSDGLMYFVAPEELIDDLSGWAGDLQTAMNDAMIICNKSNNYEIFYNSMKKIIGYNNKYEDDLENNDHSFDLDDVYADIDSYNISELLCNNHNINSLKYILTDYFSNKYTKRFYLFTKEYEYDNIGLKKRIGTYTNNSFCGISFRDYGLLKYEFTDIQLLASKQAFLDYLLEMRSNE